MQIYSNSNYYVGKKNKIKIKYYSKIEGDYSKVFNFTYEKVIRKGKIGAHNYFILFGSFDGVNQLQTVEEKNILLASHQL